MKRTLLLLSVLLVSASCGANRSRTVAPAAEESSVSLVNGVWERGEPKEINLYEVDKGQLSKIASSVPDAANKFHFAFEPAKEAFYVVGISDASPINNYTFYFKPGDKLNLKVGFESYELTGVNTPENVELTRWHDWILPMEAKSVYFMQTISTFEDFFPLMEAKLAEGYTAGVTNNPVFDRAFDHFRESYMMTVAFNFIFTPRTVHPKPEEMLDYYKDIDLSGIANAQLLDYPYGISLLGRYPLIHIMTNRGKYKEEEMVALTGAEGGVRLVNPMLRDDVLKGEFMLGFAGQIKTYDGYMDFEKKYSQYLVTADQKERLKGLLKDIPIPESAPAIDFRFPDINGNEVSLSDFKGKVVYIDVWATWCGPCKAQIPHLKKLEAEYHDNQDIVFMSVSIDADKDHKTWLDMVNDEGLGGVQLFGGSKSRVNISEPYKITGIPRFILVGKDGNIVNVNAPRPSSSEIRPLLDAALAK